MALAWGATLQADAALGFWRTGQSALPPETLIRWARAQRLLLLLPWRAQQRGWTLPAPVLAAARQEGYATAAYGKWHLGDIEESYPHNQGFDEAFFTGYNQILSMNTRKAEAATPIVKQAADRGGK